MMAFVALGFQHVVANMFIIPAAIFAGQIAWADYFPNFVAVFMGNLVEGAIFVGLTYHLAWRLPNSAAPDIRLYNSLIVNKERGVLPLCSSH